MKNKIIDIDLVRAATALRVLAVTAVEKANSGHPGMPLGFADVFTILAARFLKFNPQDPKWGRRDRLVLSAGHGSMLLYAFYYLAGYQNFTIEDIKNFRQLHSKTPGHPEYGIFPAIETTTGPLGQGFATSVGMAIAAKKYALQETRPPHKVYTIVGDGCLMEGISYEAASLAGHLGLDNLIVLFDDNSITIDGPTNITISEDQILKFQSLGWHAMRIDGHNFDEITQALTEAQSSDKPVFIACKTTIGYGCLSKAGSAASHGAPLGKDCLKQLREFFEWDYDDFIIPEDILKLWRGFSLRNEFEYKNEGSHHLEVAKISETTLDKIRALEIKANEATRVSASRAIEIIVANEPRAILGSADLSTSIGVYNKHSKPITRNDFSGNFIHYGPREHAMGAIMNGLAIEGFLPIAGTFLVFSDYMRPSIRLSSLMGLHVFYIMTHDSIGLGEDGPTHQPVEHIASLRAMPGLTVYRPAEGKETLGAFVCGMKEPSGPSLMVLSRQAIPSFEGTALEHVSKGAYFVDNKKESEITIFATGSELAIAKEVIEMLQERRINASLVSVVSFELFLKQDSYYMDEIIGDSKVKVAIEAAVNLGWHRLIGAKGLFFGVEEFGKSAPYQDLYQYFGLTPQLIYQKIMQKYENRN